MKMRDSELKIPNKQMSLREFPLKAPHKKEHGEKPSNLNSSPPSIPTIDILPDKFENIVSKLSELDSECQRLRRQNRRLRHESERCRKKLQTSGQELEGVKMENQGLKCEIEWLRKQLLHTNGTNKDETRKDEVLSSAQNSDVDSTTHSESDLTFSEGDDFSISGTYRHRSPPSMISRRRTKKNHRHGKPLEVNSINNREVATRKCTISHPAQDCDPSVSNKCGKLKPHSSSSRPCKTMMLPYPTVPCKTTMSSPRNSEKIPASGNATSHYPEEQETESSSLLDICWGMLLAEETTNGVMSARSNRSTHCTEEILSSGLPPPARTSPVSLKGRSRVILLPKRLSLP